MLPLLKSRRGDVVVTLFQESPKTTVLVLRLSGLSDGQLAVGIGLLRPLSRVRR